MENHMRTGTCSMSNEQNSQESTTISEVTPDYIRGVEALWAEQKNEFIRNDSPRFAKVLADQIVGKSKKEILIYSECLPFSCYGEAISQSTAPSIRVLVEQDVDMDAWDGLKDKLSIKKINTDIIPILKSKTNHFFVSGNAYRYETDHSTGKAFANFNDDGIMATLLADVFNTVWDKS